MDQWVAVAGFVAIAIVVPVGMLVAAKTLAMTAVDLLSDPAHIDAAREEFEQRRGPDFEYHALLGNRPPPLDYRK